VTTVELPGARAIFSTRVGGVSEGPFESLNLGILTDDTQERVTENRRRLAGEVGIEPGHVAMGWQVHGTELREWAGAPESEQAGFGDPGAELPRVDGHLTSSPDVSLLVLVADCFPVALAGDGRVAMLHCGWRGVAGGIIESALERFERDGPVAAAVGPGIGQCCFEVGEEVLERFADLDGVADGRMLDLRGAIAQKLAAAGVEEVEHVDHCTSCRPELYFSHRRDKGVTGRQAGLAVLDA
jgi:purine-nucleoside/S-methyl-5'-thioadenosine phosphorylase / adenosine deaminase